MEAFCTAMLDRRARFGLVLPRKDLRHKSATNINPMREGARIHGISYVPKGAKGLETLQAKEGVLAYCFWHL
jgi:hypothetical protein